MLNQWLTIQGKRRVKFIPDISKIVVKECHTTKLINEMDMSYLIDHAQQIEEEKLKKNSRELKGLRSVMVIFVMQGPLDMVFLDFNKIFLVKVPPMLILRSTNIGCITLSLVLHCLCILVIVKRSTKVSAQPTRMVALVMLKVVS